MNMKQLYMAREDDGAEWLTFTPEYAAHSREAKPEEVTLERMADLLDLKAEDINAHDFVCCHRGLAALLNQEVGREAATRVMRRIVNYEGLQGMVGVCGAGDTKLASQELGVPLDSW